MPTIYHDSEADLGVLKDKTIAIIGYGNQGRAQALNLRDSGLNVVVAELPGTPAYDNAKEDGVALADSTEAAAEQGDLVQVLTQDHLQAMLYNKVIGPRMTEGKALLFSHGFNIHYGQIVPPQNIDVFMVAPKGPGMLVRTQYEEGKGVPCLVAIYQNFTGNALELGKAYAKGIGGTRAGLIETTFKEETETDLFGEQAVLCGGVSELIRAGYDTLVEAGYAPEMAYYEVLHELKLIVDMINEHGITGMRMRVSDTAKYGDMTRGRQVITDCTREAMRKMLTQIQNGEFAREWILENQAGRPVYNAIMKQDAEHEIEEVGRKLRAMMPWMEG